MAPLTVLKHPPFCVASRVDPLTLLHGEAAPGELLSLAFGLAAAAPVEVVAITASDLRAPGGVIAAALLELFVVTVWQQAGIGVYQAAAMEVPELLLKDDRLPLRDGYTRHRCRHLRHLLRPPRLYAPPNARLHGAVTTSFNQGQRKQIWLSLKLPAKVAPGSYSGTIAIRTANGTPALELPLQIDVLPITLLEPQQDLFIWYKGTLDCRRPQHFVPEPLFRAQLQDIYDHGLRSISLNEFEPALLQRAVHIACAIGFARNVVLTVPEPARFAQVDFGGLTPVYYISDEIDVHDDSFVQVHRAGWQAVTQAGGQSLCSLVGQPFVQRLLDEDDIGCAPDRWSFYLPQNLGYFRAHAEFPQLHGRPTSYYWQSHMEKPNLHRVLAGLFLWKSKAAGIAPYCYQHLPQRPFSPFNDFDEWEPGFHVGAERRPFKDHMLTYPAAGGSIPTLQWKGMSAGLYDLRYLATLDALLRRADDLARAPALTTEIRRRLATLFERISLKTINIMSETDPEPYAEIDAAEYSGFRTMLARDILHLQQQIEG